MGWADQAIAELQEGRTVTIKPRGNSMLPHVPSGAEVVVEPYGDRLPAVDDIVLCRVSGSQYLHFVKAVRGAKDKQQYQIANAKGRINGWIRGRNIFGRAASVNGKERSHG